jgi:nitroreductase
MEFNKVIEGRRSIRSFEPVDVEDEKVKEILEAISYVPSAHNLQDYEVFVIKSPAKRKSMVFAALGQDFVEQAPVVFVVCADTEKEGTKKGYLYAIESASMVAYMICLKAYELGLGSCWIGAFNEDDLKDVLQLPAKLMPVAMITVGYTKENPAMPKRRDDYYHLID